MNRRRRIYEGKAKVLYEGPEPGTLIQHFKDDATAFNAKKHEVIDGKGVLTDGGVRYEGGWKYGRKSGAGVLTTPAGDRYEGAFRDDAMTGKGVLVLSDGRKYEGLLQDGRPNGQGTLTEPSGIYTGVWQNGCYSDGHRRAAFGTDPANCH